MSRNFQKNKDLVNLQVVSTKDVWRKNKNGTYSYRKDMQIYLQATRTIDWHSVPNIREEVRVGHNTTRKIFA